MRICTYTLKDSSNPEVLPVLTERHAGLIVRGYKFGLFVPVVSELNMRILSAALALLLTGLAHGAAARDVPMTFWVAQDIPEENMKRIFLDNGRHRIYAEGIITADTPAAFREFVKKNRLERATLYLNSPGGSLIGGINLGRAIREFEFGTGIGARTNQSGDTAICASSCAYAYAGGVYRYYDATSGKLGIHQFQDSANSQGDIGDIQQVSGLIVAYLNSMGVDSNAFAIATMADSGVMIWLTDQDASELRLANNGSLPTSSEIKLVEGTPYLRLNQENDDGTVRVLVSCVSGQYVLMAGIVTTNDNSRFQAEVNAVSSIEFDSQPFYELGNHAGVSVDQGTLWVERIIDPKDINSFLRANTLGIWLHNPGGAFRWGMTMDLANVRLPIANFVQNCRR